MSLWEEMLNYPIWLVEATGLTLAALLGAGIHHIVQRRVPYARLLKHNDVAGFLIAVVAVVYGVVLGFVVVIVWGKYDDAVHITQRELAAAANLYRLANGLSPDSRTRVQSDIVTYAHLMLNEEWPAMNLRSSSLKAYEQSEVLARDIINFKPADMAQSNVHAAALQNLLNLLDGRRERVRANAGVVQPILTWTLLLGMGSIITFAYFFGTENQRIQLAMTAIICAVVVSMLILIVEYNHPFMGRLCVSPDAWAAFLRYTGHSH